MNSIPRAVLIIPCALKHQVEGFSLSVRNKISLPHNGMTDLEIGMIRYGLVWLTFKSVGLNVYLVSKRISNTFPFFGIATELFLPGLLIVSKLHLLLVISYIYEFRHKEKQISLQCTSLNCFKNRIAISPKSNYFLHPLSHHVSQKSRNIS